MGVDTPRLEYVMAEPDWRRTKAALGGRSAILQDINLFLPPSPAQRRNSDMYSIYVNRAMWYGGAARTLDAWVGTLTRKPMAVTVPPRYANRLDNIDRRGTDINSFARWIVREVCAFGRFGILVDVGQGGENINDPRAVPYLAGYCAHSIKSWRTRAVDGAAVLDQVVLEEFVDHPHESGFGVVQRTAYRVLELDENGYYRARLFVMVDGEPLETETVYPTKDNNVMTYIPFLIVGPSAISPEIQKAPLQDVIDANISHYQTSADFEFSLYWSASPTAVITGLGPDDMDAYHVGGGALWKLPQGATASYLEFRGQGLDALSGALEAKQMLMATLGASVLSAPKREAETAEALTIKSNGESASLISISDTVSKALTQALQYACDWGRYDGEVSAVLNKDLVNVRLKSDDLKTLVYMVQAGLLSLDDYFYNLQQGEILRPGLSIEDAKAQTQMQAPLIAFDATASSVTAPTSPRRRKRGDAPAVAAA